MTDCPNRLFDLIFALAHCEGPYGALNYRLNNPCNLKFAGQPHATPGPHGLARFQTLAHGFIAARAQLELDYKRHPGWTLLDLSTSWAPRSDGSNLHHYANLCAALELSGHTLSTTPTLEYFMAD